MQVLKRDRFSLLLKFIHLNDNSGYIQKGDPGHNPLYKIHPFLDPLLANFQAAYVRGHELSLDEAMIGFKERLGFIQYLIMQYILLGIGKDSSLNPTGDVYFYTSPALFSDLHHLGERWNLSPDRLHDGPKTDGQTAGQHAVHDPRRFDGIEIETEPPCPRWSQRHQKAIRH